MKQSGTYKNARSEVIVKNKISVGVHRSIASPQVLIHEYRRMIFLHTLDINKNTSVYINDMVLINV